MVTTCHRCGLELKFSTAATIVCSICGQSHSLSDLESDGLVSRKAGELLAVDSSKRDFQIGDVVAVRKDDKLAIKRILALANDTVDIRQGRLLVNGKTLERLLAHQSTELPPPWMLVDCDLAKKPTRWHSESKSRPSQWKFDQHSATWQHTGKTWSTWLVYRHQNVHDHSASSEVFDDYQFNANIARKMHPVDNLSLTFDTSVAIKAKIAFWKASGPVVSTINQSYSVRADSFGSTPLIDQKAATPNSVPISKTSPIALQVYGPATIGPLRIERPVEYRLKRESRRDIYPLVVPAEHCYLIGDNVPISVDSRDYSVLPLTSIEGTVTPQIQTSK